MCNLYLPVFIVFVVAWVVILNKVLLVISLIFAVGVIVDIASVIVFNIPSDISVLLVALAATVVNVILFVLRVLTFGLSNVLVLINDNVSTGVVNCLFIKVVNVSLFVLRVLTFVLSNVLDLIDDNASTGVVNGLFVKAFLSFINCFVGRFTVVCKLMEVLVKEWL